MSVSINNLKKSVNKKCEEIKCDYEQNEVSKCNCEQINQSQELDDEIVIKYEGKRYNELEKNKEVNVENIDKFITIKKNNFVDKNYESDSIIIETEAMKKIFEKRLKETHRFISHLGSTNSEKINQKLSNKEKQEKVFIENGNNRGFTEEEVETIIKQFYGEQMDIIHITPTDSGYSLSTGSYYDYDESDAGGYGLCVKNHNEYIVTSVKYNKEEETYIVTAKIMYWNGFCADGVINTLYKDYTQKEEINLKNYGIDDEYILENSHDGVYEKVKDILPTGKFTFKNYEGELTLIKVEV